MNTTRPRPARAANMPPINTISDYIYDFFTSTLATAYFAILWTIQNLLILLVPVQIAYIYGVPLETMKGKVNSLPPPLLPAVCAGIIVIPAFLFAKQILPLGAPRNRDKRLLASLRTLVVMPLGIFSLVLMNLLLAVVVVQKEMEDGKSYLGKARRVWEVVNEK